jgi:uncharacterized membrane protein
MATNDSHAQSDEKETGRVEAFSDGLFGIAVTLLVLEIRVPPPETLPAGAHLLDLLAQQWPAYIAYVVSFLIISIMWINHHNLFKVIRRTDNLFLLLNALLLMMITFLNFPTALLADYLQQPDAQVAALVYAGTMVVISLLYNLVWRYAAWNNRLLDKSTDPAFVRSINRGYLLGPTLYSAAFLLAFVNVWLSLAVQFFLAVFFAFTRSGRRR